MREGEFQIEIFDGTEKSLEIWTYQNISNTVKKAKRFLFGPGLALVPQEVEDLRISRQSAHESGKVVNPKHRQPLPPGVQLEGLSQC